jgi:hypothetical protein
MSVYTGAELRGELLRREEEQRKRAEAARNLRAAHITRLLTICPTVVDLIVPVHGRTSCSDTNTQNGRYSNGGGEVPRCDRCLFLEAVREKYWDSDLDFYVIVTKAV